MSQPAEQLRRACDGADPEPILLSAIELARQLESSAQPLRPSNHDFAALLLAGHRLLQLGLPDGSMAAYAAAAQMARGDPYTRSYFLFRGVHAALQLLRFDEVARMLRRQANLIVDDPSIELATAQQAAEFAAADASPQDLRYLQAEATFAVASYWLAVGRYTAADIALMHCAQRAAAMRDALIRVDQVALLRGESMLDAGRLAAFDREFAGAPAGATTGAPLRILRAARLALGGELSRADELLRQALSDPSLDADTRDSSAWQRVMILHRLNRHDEAAALARDARSTHADLAALSGQLARARRSVAPHDMGMPATITERMSGHEITESAGDSSATRTPPQRRDVRLAVDVARLSWQVQLDLHHGRLDPAAESLAALRKWSAGSDSELLRARVEYLSALHDYYAGRHADSAARATDAARQFDALGMPADRWSAQRVCTWSLRRLARPPAEVRESANIEQSILQSLRRMLSPRDWITFTLNKSTIIDDTADAILQRAGGTRRGLRRALEKAAVLRRWADPTAIDPPVDVPDDVGDVYQWVSRQLRLRRQARGGRVHAKIKPAWLAEDQAVLYFVALPSRLHTYLITRGHGVCEVDPAGPAVTREQLREAVRDVLTGFDGLRPGRAPAGGASLEPALRHAAELLRIPQALAGLKTDRRLRLAIVPDDALVSLPFAALPVNGAPLVERCDITLLPELAWQNIPDSAPIDRARGIAARHPDLVFSESELERIRDAISGAEFAPIGEPEAPLDALAAELQSADFVHFACHGRFDPAAPHRSGIVLAGEDRVLTVERIQQLDLNRLRLVVAGCCWSGDMAILPGREMIGVPAALMAAGAHRVIASLWQISDPHSPDFMVELYALLRRHRADFALAETQRKWRDRNPWLWAGLALHQRALRPGSWWGRMLTRIATRG